MLLSVDFILISACIFFVAALVHGSIGFAFPMITTPLLALFMDIQSAIILTLIPTLLVNIVSIASESHFNLESFIAALKRHFLLAVYALFGTILGTLVLIKSDSEFFKVILAFAILIYLLSGQIKLNLPWFLEYPRITKLLFGLSAGVLGGLTNVMAPILIIYSIESKKSKQDIIQASNLCFLFGKVTQIIMFTTAATFTVNELSISSLMFVVTAIALAFGLKIKKQIKSDKYIKILKTMLFMIALVILVQYYV